MPSRVISPIQNKGNCTAALTGGGGADSGGAGGSLGIASNSHSGERSANCGPRRRREPRKDRRTWRLSNRKLMSRQYCRCRSIRFRAQPSWRLQIRYTCRATVALLRGQHGDVFWTTTFP
jgi:hypothetical protein